MNFINIVSGNVILKNFEGDRSKFIAVCENGFYKEKIHGGHIEFYIKNGKFNGIFIQMKNERKKHHRGY